MAKDFQACIYKGSVALRRWWLWLGDERGGEVNYLSGGLEDRLFDCAWEPWRFAQDDERNGAGIVRLEALKIFKRSHLQTEPDLAHKADGRSRCCLLLYLLYRGCQGFAVFAARTSPN